MSDVIQAAAVLKDEQRLALDGYKHAVSFGGEAGLTSLSVVLTSGQQELGGRVHVAHVENSPEGLAEYTRLVPLIEAIVGYLNAHGSPKTLLAIAQRLEPLPQLSTADFKFIGLEQEELDRRVYFKSLKDGRYVRVFPDEFAEFLSDMEAFELEQEYGLKDGKEESS